jgi:membrane-associated protein
MDNFPDFLNLLLDSEKLIAYGGLTLLLLIIFAETGLFFGFFFPGDALLFSSGLLCGTQVFDVNIFVLLFSVTFAAFSGNAVGYISGKIFGKKLFAKDDSFFFKKRHLEKTKSFYEKYGGSSLIGGRFLPIVRTFVPIFAGAIDMNFWKFSMYNLIGAFLWIWTLIPIGYFLGKQYPGLINKLEYIILGFVLITTIILFRGAKKLKTKKQIEIDKI